ncbi:hypothetical protein GCM10007086_21440 [Photobacterium aphoticum]|nr:hypothetical protein GCM10007086_21440 [Photobacterium aphoticum]
MIQAITDVERGKTAMRKKRKCKTKGKRQSGDNNRQNIDKYVRVIDGQDRNRPPFRRTAAS